MRILLFVHGVQRASEKIESVLDFRSLFGMNKALFQGWRDLPVERPHCKACAGPLMACEFVFLASVASEAKAGPDLVIPFLQNLIGVVDSRARVHRARVFILLMTLNGSVCADA